MDNGFIEVMPSEIKTEDKRLKKMEGSDFLPKLPATILVLGSAGAGKSSFLWSVMTKGYVYGSKKKSIFDEMLVYLGTLDAKSSFEKFPVENQLILTEFDADVFESYCDDLRTHQLERLSEKKHPLNTCVIFDDFFGENLMKRSSTGKARPIEKMAVTSRHELNMTCIYLSQAYKNSGFASPTIRANLTTIILYKMPINEIRKILEEYSDSYEVDELISHYDTIMMSAPYQFLVWDRRRPLNKDRWTHGFTKPLPPSKKVLEYEAKLNRS
jgi:GTPase SAR1 family protein